ncbi:KGG domain-containing protein [Oxalobacter sp. OxGP1]|uniref:KGG domain-containing protein n=1 Tax=Oxalobacter paeniformigenes TaxID=2946594 RepID=UPI0022AEA5AB|nr:KGG domain-containing protein [Oxalobacter paeniformigenes]MCZ4052342.1 KGG domain-containing protein [Oxalobacter paeniformigenes]
MVSPSKNRREVARGGRPSKRGFAAMDPEKQRAIASMGGKAAHAKGTAHQFTSEEARAAGRKGGAAVSRDRKHMAEIGRKGGTNGIRQALQETVVTTD